jgi:hypothetical protein
VFEVKKFSFANETRAEGALAKLKQRIPQVGVPAEARAKILEELAGNLPLLQHVLRLLEIALGFLSATTATLAGQGEQGVADYLKDTLLLAEAVPSSIEKHVQLRHVEWLWRLLVRCEIGFFLQFWVFVLSSDGIIVLPFCLPFISSHFQEDQLGIDPFRDVNQAYKKPLSLADAETVKYETLSFIYLCLFCLVVLFVCLVVLFVSEYPNTHDQAHGSEARTESALAGDEEVSG